MVGTGTYLSVLDASIVNISLPVITQALRTDLVTVQWVVMIYLLMITGLLLTFGRLADIWGRKRVFILGMAIFSLTVALCGLAQDIRQLVLFRAAEGVGSAMVMAVGPALIASAFPLAERGRAMGLNAMIVAAGAITGPVLGGLLTDWLDWRMVFILRSPICAGATLFAAHNLVQSPRESQRAFDLFGAVVLFIWMSALTLGLNQGASLGWDNPLIVGLLLLALLGFVTFLLIEARVDSPMLSLSVFRNRLFATASISSLLSFMATFAINLLMPFYLMRALDYTPGEAGVMLLPQAVIMSVFAPISGWLSDRIGSAILSSVGIATTGLGLLLLSFLNVSSTPLDIVLRLAVVGVGTGLFGSPNNAAMLSALPPRQMGIASGMMGTMRNMGMVSGTAIAGAIFTSRLAEYTASLTAQAAGTAEEIAMWAFVGGIQDAFRFSAFLCLIGVFTSSVRGQPQSHPDGAINPATTPTKR